MSKKASTQTNLTDLQRQLGRTIGDVSRAWRYEMNLRLKPFGLNLSMRQVLVQLQRHPEGLMQKDLARKLGIENPTLAKLLDQLEKKDWVRRIASDQDRRCKFSILTPNASAQIRIIEKLSREMRSEMMQGLNPAEIEKCLAVMMRVKQNLLAL